MAISKRPEPVRRATGATMLILTIALLACKKGSDEPAPETTATAAPAAPAPAPEVVKAKEDPEPAASAEASDETPAPAAPAKTAAATPTATTTAKPDAAAPARPAGNEAGYKQISACCGALSKEAKKGGMTQNKYTSAAAVCSGIAQQVKKGSADPSAAKTLIRAQLHGVPVPSGC